MVKDDKKECPVSQSGTPLKKYEFKISCGGILFAHKRDKRLNSVIGTNALTEGFIKGV